MKASVAREDGLIGFLTRLATICKPALRVRDNRSVVMSDFYSEQIRSLSCWRASPASPRAA